MPTACVMCSVDLAFDPQIDSRSSCSVYHYLNPSHHTNAVRVTEHPHRRNRQRSEYPVICRKSDRVSGHFAVEFVASGVAFE